MEYREHASHIKDGEITDLRYSAVRSSCDAEGHTFLSIIHPGGAGITF